MATIDNLKMGSKNLTIRKKCLNNIKAPSSCAMVEQRNKHLYSIDGICQADD